LDGAGHHHVLRYPELVTGNGHLLSVAPFPTVVTRPAPHEHGHFVAMFGEFVAHAAAGKSAQLPCERNGKIAAPAPAKEPELLTPCSIKRIGAPEPAIVVPLRRHVALLKLFRRKRLLLSPLLPQCRMSSINLLKRRSLPELKQNPKLYGRAARSTCPKRNSHSPRAS